MRLWRPKGTASSRAAPAEPPTARVVIEGINRHNMRRNSPCSAPVISTGACAADGGDVPKRGRKGALVPAAGHALLLVNPRVLSRSRPKSCGVTTIALRGAPPPQELGGHHRRRHRASGVRHRQADCREAR